ncbi:hypothetical protein [Nocardia testacea]|uniref:hypothetical protein n=1 Tax=Nocardia testacea TaxID=248551 RepID=UPI0033E382CD
MAPAAPLSADAPRWPSLRRSARLRGGRRRRVALSLLILYSEIRQPLAERDVRRKNRGHDWWSGVRLAVEMGAASVDHVTYVTRADIDALAGSSTVATPNWPRCSALGHG